MPLEAHNNHTLSKRGLFSCDLKEFRRNELDKLVGMSANSSSWATAISTSSKVDRKTTRISSDYHHALST